MSHSDSDDGADDNGDFGRVTLVVPDTTGRASAAEEEEDEDEDDDDDDDEGEGEDSFNPNDVMRKSVRRLSHVNHPELILEEEKNNKPLTAKERETLDAEFGNLQAQIQKKSSQIERMRTDYQKEVGMLKRIIKKREDDYKKGIEKVEDDGASEIFYFSANLYAADGFDSTKASAEVEGMLRKGLSIWMSKQTEKVTALQEALVAASVRQAHLDKMVSNAMGFLKVSNAEAFIDNILSADAPNDKDSEKSFTDTLEKLDQRAAEAAIKIKDQMAGDAMDGDDKDDAAMMMTKLNSTVHNSATEVMNTIEREQKQKKEKIRQELLEAEEKRDLFDWHTENIANCLPDGALDTKEEEAPQSEDATPARKIKRCESSVDSRSSINDYRFSKVDQRLPITLAESFFQVASQLAPRSARAAFERRKKALNTGHGRHGNRRSLDTSSRTWDPDNDFGPGRMRPRANTIGSPYGVGSELMKMIQSMDMERSLAAKLESMDMEKTRDAGVQTSVKCKHLGPIGLTPLNPRGSTRRATSDRNGPGFSMSDDIRSQLGLGNESGAFGSKRLQGWDRRGSAEGSPHAAGARQSLKAGSGPLEALVSPGGKWTLIRQNLNAAVEAAQASGSSPSARNSLHRMSSAGTEEKFEDRRTRTSIIGGTSGLALDSEQSPVLYSPELQRPLTSLSLSSAWTQQSTTPMPTRPQTSFDANRMLIDGVTESQTSCTLSNLPSMHGANVNLDALGTQDRHGLVDTSNAMSPAEGFDISTSLNSGHGDHSQSLEWQASRESPVLPPWASWTDGRGKPSYIRAGGWLVSLKQAQMGTEKTLGPNSGHQLTKPSSTRSAASSRPNKHNTSVDTWHTTSVASHLSSNSPVSPTNFTSAQLWQSMDNSDVFLASQGGTRVNLDSFFARPMEAEFSLSEDELYQLQAEVSMSRRGRTRTCRHDASRSRSRGHASSGSHSRSRSRSASASPLRSPSCPRSPSVERTHGILKATLEPKTPIWTPQHGYRKEDFGRLVEGPAFALTGSRGMPGSRTSP